MEDGGAWILGTAKDTTKTDSSDLWVEYSLVYTKCCAVLQKSRGKDDKLSMTVDTQVPFTAKLVTE